MHADLPCFSHGVDALTAVKASAACDFGSCHRVRRPLVLEIVITYAEEVSMCHCRMKQVVHTPAYSTSYLLSLMVLCMHLAIDTELQVS